MGRPPRSRQHDSAAGGRADAVVVDPARAAGSGRPLRPAVDVQEPRVHLSGRALAGPGIGANTAIYSFMDAILVRSLPVSDPASLVVVKWRSRPFAFGSRSAAAVRPAFRRRRVLRRPRRCDGGDFSLPGVRAAAAGVGAGSLQLLHAQARRQSEHADRGEAELARGEYVSGGFFRGLAVVPAAGRLLLATTTALAPPPSRSSAWASASGASVTPTNAAGQQILINNAAVHGGRRDAARVLRRRSGDAPQVYLPMHANLLLDPDAEAAYHDPNYYWVKMMGRLSPASTCAQAQAALARPFAEWVASTATNDAERANLPVLHLERGRRRPRQPSSPLLEAALRPPGDGRPDPGDCVREHGQSPACACRSPQARDRSAAQHRRGPVPRSYANC